MDYGPLCKSPVVLTDREEIKLAILLASEGALTEVSPNSFALLSPLVENLLLNEVIYNMDARKPDEFSQLIKNLRLI